MLKNKRFFIALFLVFAMFSSTVFAAQNSEMTVTSDMVTTAAKPQGEVFNKDMFYSDMDSYTFSDTVNGNVFASAQKFTTNPRNGGGIISGNLFLAASEATIDSDITYSDKQDRDGNYIINTINSKSVVRGNVYVVADSFTLAAGSEIHGDLYVAAKTVNIGQDAVIGGNVFITASSVTLNGQISGSAYITTQNFNMNYYSYISQDLNLTSENATLAGVIYRNAFISAYTSLNLKSDFKVNQDLTVDYSGDMVFAGEVNGNATITAKALTFQTDNNDGYVQKCSIGKDLKYSTPKDIQIPDSVVNGTVSTFKFKAKSANSVSFSSIVLSLLTFVFYVFCIVFLVKFFTRNTQKELPALNAKNILASLGLGFASFFAITLIFVVLCLIKIGVTLAFALVLAYVCMLTLALPLFIYNISKHLKFKMNSYLKLLIVTAIFYIIRLIPVIGNLVFFVTFFIGVGEILLRTFKKD